MTPQAVSADQAPAPVGRHSARMLLTRSVLLQVVTTVNQWAMLVAVQTDAAYRLHQGGGFLVLVSVVAGLPMLTNRFFGKLCDRFGPRPLGLASTMLTAAVAATAAVSASGPMSMFIILGASALPRAMSQACADTLPTWLPSRPSYALASVWMSVAQGAPFVVGPSLAAALTVSYGVRVAFAACAVLEVVGTIILIGTPTRRPESVDRSGLRVQGNRSLLRVLVAFSATAFSYAVVEPLQPLYLARIVHAPPEWLAFNDGVFGVTSAAAALCLVRISRVVAWRGALGCGLVAVAVSEIVIFATGSAVVSAVGNGLFGVSVAVLAPSTRVRMLTSVPETEHGQILGTMRTVRGVAILACTAVGPLTATIGPQAVVCIVATVLASTALLNARHPASDS
jgi:MFS family permease